MMLTLKEGEQKFFRDLFGNSLIVNLLAPVSSFPETQGIEGAQQVLDRLQISRSLPNGAPQKEPCKTLSPRRGQKIEADLPKPPGLHPGEVPLNEGIVKKLSFFKELFYLRKEVVLVQEETDLPDIVDPLLFQKLRRGHPEPDHWLVDFDERSHLSHPEIEVGFLQKKRVEVVIKSPDLLYNRPSDHDGRGTRFEK